MITKNNEIRILVMGKLFRSKFLIVCGNVRMFRLLLNKSGEMNQ